MNSIMKIVIPFVGLVVFLTTISADMNKGQKIYQKKLNSPCGFICQ